jgi:ketol-acid reductoisomerase
MAQKYNQSLIRFLRKYKIAVLGFGSQGMAQAFNLRDSGITPIIGLRPKSKSIAKARKAGFDVVHSSQAIQRASIISVLIPDHKHKEFFDGIAAEKLAGKAFIFAHGLSVAFGLVKLPASCDIILVAPHGPGIRLREIYLAGKSFTSFWAVANDASGQARKIAKAYAAAIGCPPANLFKSSFRDEAVGDIFGEQAVLCGGLTGLMESVFETLVHHGLSPESAYLECIHQLDLIVDLIKKFGPAGMFERISKTAAFGSMRSRGKLFDRDMKRKMEQIYGEIESGRFARTLVAENRKGMKDLKASLKNYKRSLLQKTHDKLAKRLLIT